MCGRYTLKSTGQDIANVFGLTNSPDLAERYNIAPTQNVPVVLEEDRQKTRGDALELDTLLG